MSFPIILLSVIAGNEVNELGIKDGKHETLRNSEKCATFTYNKNKNKTQQWNQVKTELFRIPMKICSSNEERI